MLNRTSSQMWDNWNFPMFLLRDGSLTAHALLDGSCDVMRLPNHDGEIVHSGIMTCDGPRWMKNPLDIPQTFPQRSLQIPLFTPHCNLTCHTYTCILPRSSV